LIEVTKENVLMHEEIFAPVWTCVKFNEN